MEFPEDQIRALANPMRIEILRVLKNPERNFPHALSNDPKIKGVNIKTLAKHFHKSEATMSRHIALLRRAKFINTTRHINHIYCSQNNDSIRKYHNWLENSALKNF